MKFITVLSAMFLCACGSAADKIADAITAGNATPTPAPIATAPVPVVTAQPTVRPARSRDMYDDYRKVSKGMTRDEVITILGEYQGRDTQTFCDNGECRDYEYLSWYYNQGKIGVTIQSGVATYTYTM